MTKILVGSQENVSGSTSYLVPLQTIKLAGLLDLIKINIFSTLILVGSVIKFLDRNFLFNENKPFERKGENFPEFHKKLIRRFIF